MIDKRVDEKMAIEVNLQKIRAGELAPVYLVLGEEQYLSDHFRSTLYNAVIQSDDDDLNFASFDMTTVPLSEALEEASTIPFFGDQRLVQIEQPYFLTGQKKVGGPEHNLEELLKYLENPSESSVVVFYAPYEKLDERKKIVKLLKKQAVLIDVKNMNEKEVRQYVRQSINSSGYEITPEAFELLIRLTDMDLSKVMGELTKLMLYASADKKILVEMVENLVPKSLEHNIFDMVTYVMSGKTEQALSLFRDLTLQGEDSIKINAILISQFRLYVQVKILQGKGYQQSNIVDVLKLHPYRVKLAMQEVRRYNLADLQVTFAELVENDYKIKTGRMDKNLIFELFILKYSQK